EDALLFVFEPRFEMDAISPDVDVALGRQIALLPRGVLVEPAVLQSADGGCRQSGSILAKQRRQRLGEVASRYPLQIKDRQQRLDRLRATHVGRQDRRREPDAARIGSGGLAVAYTRLADGDRTDTGHHLALRQVTVADDALVAVLGLQIGMLAEKVCDLGLDRLSEKGTCPVAQDFCELIVEDSWLNQMDDVIVGHGISLLRWRSGGVKHPQDMPPSRFPPSPTLGDSSDAGVLADFRPPTPPTMGQPKLASPRRPTAGIYRWRRYWSRPRAARRSGRRTSSARSARALLRNRNAPATLLVLASADAHRRSPPRPRSHRCVAGGSLRPDPCRSPLRRTASASPPAEYAARPRRRRQAAGHRRSARAPACNWSGNACPAPANWARLARDRTT